MLKFFRKIRYDLMGKNKAGKYLKYTIGEILLVVVGILIALQINNWNETQKGKVKATTILEDIRSDMHKDLQNIENMKPYWEREILYFKNLLPSFGSISEIANIARVDNKPSKV